MIIAYVAGGTLKPYEITPENKELLHAATWIDLLCPSKQEENLIEQTFALEIPTREEMREIELSSRLYKDNGALFMTSMMLAQSDSHEPKYDAVSFVLTDKHLFTVRYVDPFSFKKFVSQLPKFPVATCSAANLLIELLEITVDRLADILEVVGHRLEDYSKTIFHSQHDHDEVEKHDYQLLMEQLGANGELNTKARESLMMFNRLMVFFGSSAKLNDEGQLRLTTMRKDIHSLSDHATFLSNKVNFLLDATLGMISIEQNNIIKIFSVAAVIFLPPTLIASIYGMNFKMMPELNWKWGYVSAICLMFISALVPYLYFKRRKWL